MGRAERKHHEWRLRLKRKKYFMTGDGSSDTMNGKVFHSPALCSCDMCGNPRHSEASKKDTLTIQERRENEKGLE